MVPGGLCGNDDDDNDDHAMDDHDHDDHANDNDDHDDHANDDDDEKCNKEEVPHAHNFCGNFNNRGNN